MGMSSFWFSCADITQNHNEITFYKSVNNNNISSENNNPSVKELMSDKNVK